MRKDRINILNLVLDPMNRSTGLAMLVLDYMQLFQLIPEARDVSEHPALLSILPATCSISVS